MAGPFSPEEWSRHVPVDKKLDPAWLRSLVVRGQPTVYSKSRDELRYIGMPVGGICTGTLYLSGDGRLWLWDIFNRNENGILPHGKVLWTETGFAFHNSSADPKRALDAISGLSYYRPHTIDESPKIAQGLALRIQSEGQDAPQYRTLDSDGWAEVEFTGQYPIGTITYRDPASPVSVRLEAFSPFCPLDAEFSGLPATILHCTLRNDGRHVVEAELAGWMQNACSFFNAPTRFGRRINRTIKRNDSTIIASCFEPNSSANVRPDILIADFENGYGAWKVEGTAFGKAPVGRDKAPKHQGKVGGEGSAIASSYPTVKGMTNADKDAALGRLVSPPFVIERRFLSFFISGGKNLEKLAVRLLVDGRVVRKATGERSNFMRREAFEISEFAGQTAVIEIADEDAGSWGQLSVDHFVLTDSPKGEAALEKRGDFGTMALALIGGIQGGAVASAIQGIPASSAELFALAEKHEVASEPGSPLIGVLRKKVTLQPGASCEINFAITWHFPNSQIKVDDAAKGNFYATRFADATAVAAYVASNFASLANTTRLWRDTWVDSTLPHWLLERTFLNTSILATTTCHRFGTGRFWAWEGVGCCAGTCTHVWQYAQAVGRIFPALERGLREHVDFGIALDPKTGHIGYRGERTHAAVDGQAGRILGMWREHQMSAGDAFLRRTWPGVKRATQHLLDHDANNDGLIEGPQHNTLDADWYGEIAWISSIAIAAWKAASLMAEEVGDLDFARICRERYEKGRRSIETRLYNGEYFIHRPESGRENTLGTYNTCHADQVFGQSWAWQVGLGRILDAEKTVSALRALWKYNFSPNVGPFRELHRDGRIYALAGEAGLILAANPRMESNPYGAKGWQDAYFNECWTGFEHQVASHMIAEGMVTEGLAITRAVHDRYHAARRNPFNEIECSDHYARAMSSYGTFISLCGFTYHGPKRQIGFEPRITPEKFRAAFTSAEGWGTFAQELKDDGKFCAKLQLRWGKLAMCSLALTVPKLISTQGKPTVSLDGHIIASEYALTGKRVTITLHKETIIETGQILDVAFG